jgi:hypothetical protein
MPRGRRALEARNLHAVAEMIVASALGGRRAGHTIEMIFRSEIRCETFGDATGLAICDLGGGKMQSR